MKKTLPFLIVIMVLTWGCSQPQETLPARIEKKMASHRTIHYKVTEKALYAWSPDTIVTPYEVWAVREDKDTLRHGYVWVNNYYRPYHMIYDHGNFYLAIPPKKTTVLYPHFTGSFISPVDWIDIFLQPALLSDPAKNQETTLTSRDTTWQGRKAIAMKIRKTTRRGAETSLYILDEKELVPLFARFERTGEGTSFLDELSFSGYTFDHTDPAQLEKKQQEVLAANPVERESAGSETARLEKMLHPGDPAPLITGKVYADGKPFALKDYIGKNIIIVDFWYTHCPPCVRAVPALSQLYKEKKDQGLKIFGLNSVDNQPHSMANLKKFLEKRDVSYDIILTQPETDLQYKINGYPSMYVIDKQGRIAWVEIGFNEKKFEQLKNKIDELLKK